MNKRHYFTRFGRFEIYAQGWERQAGESLVSTLKTREGVWSALRVWVPGLHFIVSYRRSAGEASESLCGERMGEA